MQTTYDNQNRLMIIKKSTPEAVSIKITTTTARATYALCSVGSHDSSSAAGSVRVQGQFEPRRVPQLRRAHHCDVPLGRVSAHTGTGDAWVADPRGCVSQNTGCSGAQPPALEVGDAFLCRLRGQAG